MNCTAEYINACESKADRWVAACGGHETPFFHNRTRWLYVYNPAKDEHGYLNLLTDIVQENAPWAWQTQSTWYTETLLRLTETPASPR